MSDWQKGDLALCVDAGPLKDLCGNGGRETKAEYVANLRLGAVFTVTDIAVCGCGGSHLGIGFRPERAGGSATRFRKVTPPAADDFDREVIELMTGKPVRHPA